MNAEVISVGTELLLGEITDTNATWISQQLQKLGINLIFRTTVGDNELRIASAISIALRRVDVVILSGGLGPTVDDVTREAIARATGRPLEFHQVLLNQISERFSNLRVRMTSNNRRQAFAPQGAILIENPVGTAPIFELEFESKVIMCLPGVPREMQYLFENELVPRLKKRVGAPSAIISLTLRTAGIGESVIDSKIDDLMRLTNPTVGLAAHSGQTDIRITAKAKTEGAAAVLIQPIEKQIRERLGDWIYAIGDVAIEETVSSRLASLGMQISIIEIGTDNSLQSRLMGARDGSGLQLSSSRYRLSKSISLIDQAEAFSRRALADHGTNLAAVALLRVSSLTDAAVLVSNGANTISRSYSWATPRSDASIWASTQCMALMLRLLDGRTD